MQGITTLCTKGNWHFFIKDADYDFVYLSFFLGHNDVPKGRNITFESPVEIRIPIHVWREINASWQKSSWASNEKLDNMTRDGQKIMEAFKILKEKE